MTVFFYDLVIMRSFDNLDFIKSKTFTMHGFVSDRKYDYCSS